MESCGAVDTPRLSAELVVELLAGARRVAALTGAGMSQESGVPTFRDAQTGLWSRYDAAELASPQAFRRHPDRVFGWYLERWRTACRAEPHAGHRALAALETMYDDFLVITQNVDGLHQRAGSRDVVELHGSLEAFRCADAGHPADPASVAALEAPASGLVPPPRCAVCGSPVRPGVVWFGELLPQPAVERAWHWVGRCDVLLVIGTSSLVYPAAHLPAIARAVGARVIEINPQATALSERADVWWDERAGTALPALLEHLSRGRSA